MTSPVVVERPRILWEKLQVPKPSAAIMARDL